jgi:hypothetical protein
MLRKKGKRLAGRELFITTNTGILRSQDPPPPQDHHRALGMGLLQGPREGLFLMSEVTLQGRQIDPAHVDIRGYLDYKKLPPRRTLQ